MKLIFIASSLAIIYYMRVHKVVKQTYDASEDTFRVLFLVAPCAVLALAINQQHNSPVEVQSALSLELSVRHVVLSFYENQSGAESSLKRVITDDTGVMY